MDKQWIPASKALEIAATATTPYAARLALCSRAHQNLLETRAASFSIGEAKRDNTIVPGRFWWAKGHDALEQNWEIGDFSTWIDRKEEWKAFGVSFDLDGVLELVPTEQRGRIRLAQSVAGNPDWIRGTEARRIINERAGVVEPYTAGVLIDHCRLGFVSARAVLMQRSENFDPPNWSVELREWDVPRWFWSDFTASPTWTADWKRGFFEGRGRIASKNTWIRLTDARFLEDGINALYPPPASSEALVRTSSIKGGRPPAAFWDDLWSAVTAQLYRGDLHPKRQADIEATMLEWASAKGYELSVSSVRERARKLFAAIKDQDE